MTGISRLSRLSSRSSIELDEDILATGFELAEVDTLLLEKDGDSPEAEVLPPLPQTSASQSGDVWVLGDHRLVQGDAHDREAYQHLLKPDELVRLALTDVPFTRR